MGRLNQPGSIRLLLQDFAKAVEEFTLLTVVFDLFR
jgi:hypothetical protein